VGGVGCRKGLKELVWQEMVGINTNLRLTYPPGLPLLTVCCASRRRDGCGHFKVTGAWGVAASVGHPKHLRHVDPRQAAWAGGACGPCALHLCVAHVFPTAALHPPAAEVHKVAMPQCARRLPRRPAAGLGKVGQRLGGRHKARARLGGNAGNAASCDGRCNRGG